jgi:S1-C subfamily serine protease
LVAVLLEGLTFPTGAQDNDPGKAIEAIQQQVRTVFEKCQAAVVKIEAVDNHGRLSGTGFFIDPNGTLYTSYSVGGETRDIVVTLDNVRHSATRIVSDLRSGVAILKIQAATPFLVFGKSRDLSVASPVITIGYPMDLPASPSFGFVAGFDIKYLGRYFATSHVRANLPVQRGQGGAPLLNLHGEVVGILISSLDQGSASFALPIEAAEKVRKDFLRFREVRRGWLGLEIEAISQAVDGSTAGVKDVFADSPAHKAGIRAGDVLLLVGQHQVRTPEDVLDAAFYLTADDEVPLRISRNEEKIELKAQPIDHPDDLSALRRLAPAFPSGPELPLQPPRDGR